MQICLPRAEFSIHLIFVINLSCHSVTFFILIGSCLDVLQRGVKTLSVAHLLLLLFTFIICHTITFWETIHQSKQCLVPSVPWSSNLYVIKWHLWFYLLSIKPILYHVFALWDWSWFNILRSYSSYSALTCISWVWSLWRIKWWITG